MHMNIFTMESFLVQLWPCVFTILRKMDSLLVKFYKISFLQKTAGGLLKISSNILDIACSISNKLTQSQLTVCLGPPQRTVRKQFTVFVLKTFKITKIERIVFLAEVDITFKKRYLAEAVTQRCFVKQAF